MSNGAGLFGDVILIVKKYVADDALRYLTFRDILSCFKEQSLLCMCDPELCSLDPVFSQAYQDVIEFPYSDS